jgi:oligosaccharide 4-alpha-D-glucosyltransferase
MDYPLTIDNIPVFAKAGSFIPMTKPVTSTDYYNGGNYVVRYYPHGKSEFVQYEDNGLDSKSVAEGKFELITYKGLSESGKTIVSISKTGAWEGMPASRTMKLKIRSSKLPAKVLINGKAVKVKAEKGKSTGKKTSVTYDEKWLYVNFTWDGKPITVDILDNQ